MRNFKIAAAVAAVLVSGSAMALPPSTTTFGVTLDIAGASAQTSTFTAAIEQIAADGTLDEYRASTGNFRVWTFTIDPALGAPLGGLAARVRYRAEGGSIWGVATVAKGLPAAQLIVSAGNCTTAVFPAAGSCTNTYAAGTDTGTNLERVTVQLGVSDVEAAQFVGENYPADPVLGSEPPSPAQLGNITSTTATGTTFGVLVNSANPVVNMSRQDITAVFSGAALDWSQIPNAAGTAGITAGPIGANLIKVCRRAPGSGTQTSASIYFNGVGCSPAALPFVSAPNGPFGNPVEEYSSSSGIPPCVSGDVNAIGIVDFTTSPAAGTKFVTIDGVAPSKVNAALGTYRFAFESAFNQPATTGGLSLTLLNLLKSNATTAANIPVNANAFALENNGVNTPVLPIDPTRPVALATRGGNSCQEPQRAFFP